MATLWLRDDKGRAALVVFSIAVADRALPCCSVPEIKAGSQSRQCSDSMCNCTECTEVAPVAYASAASCRMDELVRAETARTSSPSTTSVRTGQTQEHGERSDESTAVEATRLGGIGAQRLKMASREKGGDDAANCESTSSPELPCVARHTSPIDRRSSWTRLHFADRFPRPGWEGGSINCDVAGQTEKAGI